jgi:hypothetical protein
MADGDGALLTGSLAIDALVRSDIERSRARVAEIELGLSGPDADLWREVARRRADALEDDRHLFGLLPHEEQEQEQEQLRALLARTAGCDGIGE